MKTSLSHLPQHKQEQIDKITRIIKEVVDSEKIILFGSYATGNWVEDRYTEGHITFEYVSDYDFLVVVKSGEKLQSDVVQDMIENRCHFREPVNAIIHDIDYINQALSEGQYFFSDIYKEGILLYDAENVPFEKPRKLSFSETRAIAQGDFDKWYTSGEQFLNYAEFAFRDSLSKNKTLNAAAFILHQSAERFYNAVILVFTGYKTKTHNLHKLRRHTKRFSVELASIFPYPTEDQQEKRFFDLLKKGYIDARYKDDYKITEEEFSILLNRVYLLKEVVKELCQEKIDSLS